MHKCNSDFTPLKNNQVKPSNRGSLYISWQGTIMSTKWLMALLHRFSILGIIDACVENLLVHYISLDPSIVYHKYIQEFGKHSEQGQNTHNTNAGVMSRWNSSSDGDWGRGISLAHGDAGSGMELAHSTWLIEGSIVETASEESGGYGHTALGAFWRNEGSEWVFSELWMAITGP